MSTKKHSKILSVLEQRALRWRNKAVHSHNEDDLLHRAALDETGTVDTAPFSDSDGECESIDSTETNTTEQRRGLGIEGILEEVLEVHGVAPTRKAEGVTRLVMENPNGFSTNISGNEKLEKAKEVIDDLEADLVALPEHKVNCRHKHNRNGFRQMFHGGEADIRAVAAHNVHENVSKHQEGGTALLAYGSIVEQYDFEHSGKDNTGLGRWVSMVFRGSEGVTTRIVCGYNPCYNTRKESRTFYQQNRRYLITKEKDTSCPRKRFRDDLVRQLAKWRDSGERLVVCMDVNEDIYAKSIGKALTDTEGLDMAEVVGEFTGKRVGATYYRGRKPIDGIWATRDMQVVGACVMPAGFGVGDHRMFVVDFCTASLIGLAPPKIVRSQSRRLNTMIPGVEARYLRVLEQLMTRHKMVPKLMAAASTQDRAECKTRMDAVDAEETQHRRHAEKKCRRIKSGRIPFSPESTVWIRRCQVYVSALRLHAGKIKNRGNLKRKARRCGVPGVLKLPLSVLREKLREARAQCDHFARHGHRHRRQHLERRLSAARRRADDEAEQRVIDIITREKTRADWRRRKNQMGKKQGRSVRLVHTDDGAVHEGKDEVENAIFTGIHQQRYHVAEQAPICQGRLRGEFGYLANTRASAAVLAGNYDFPEGMHQGTRELMEEVAAIRALIPKDSVSTTITPTQWRRRWRGTKERTSSSPSGRHFGHCIAGAKSRTVAYFDSVVATVPLKKGFALSRHAVGLTAMIEKKPGATSIAKLRAILLMEADFNKSLKEIFGCRMMDSVRSNGLMQDEIFSEKGRTSDDGALEKVLIFDISRQGRITMGLASIDAANCYDSIAHAIGSLVCQSLGVPLEAVQSMLSAIQNMKFFLRTAYGDSKNCVGSTVSVKFQGYCQGSGAAPAGWAVISVVILRAHKRKGHGATFVCPVSRNVSKLAAILFVDDTDIIHMRMDLDESAEDAHLAMQQSIDSWGALLMATGGAFKPEKCFAYLVSYGWRPNGDWFHEANEGLPEFGFSVPLPGDGRASIDHMSMQTAKETLGVLSCPSGAATPALQSLRAKASDWVARAQEGRPSRQDIWFLLECQLRPGLRYALECNLASWRQLSDCLDKQWWQTLPLGGVVRAAPAAVRQMGPGFYGVGCPHLGIECLEAQLGKLLTHFGCSSSTSLRMQASLELMVLEMGVSAQPLQQSYSEYSDWVTHCWLKTLWEKLDLFNVLVEFHCLPVKMGRERDKWLMLELTRLGLAKQELKRLNRVRIHYQVLFLSDILGASGKHLDKKYLAPKDPAERWSEFNFPREQPPTRDVKLWWRVLRQLVPNVGIADRLGPLGPDSPKIWDWRWDISRQRLLHYVDGKMDVYKPTNVLRYRGTRNRWTRLRIAQEPDVCGEICTVREVALAVVAVDSTATMAEPRQAPETLLEVLDEWECGWMWDSLSLTGDEDWLLEAIEEGTCVAVTDGSYIKELFPDVCSAAFVLECSRGRGTIVGSFEEQSNVACAYRAELLGLMAIHLILLAANKLRPEVRGLVAVFSDCLGAVRRVADLPEARIPNSWKHGDILKNIMVNCCELSFEIAYRHVKAHQDDHELFADLSRQAQLNCVMDWMAKRVLQARARDLKNPCKVFPLEPVTARVGTCNKGEKISPGMMGGLRFWAHRRLAREVFRDLGILGFQAFDQVAWRPVHNALLSVPRLFQLWAAKQVTGIAGTNLRLHICSRRKPNPHCKLCPSCGIKTEDCEHVLTCEESNRVDCLLKSIDMIDKWLEENGTEPRLRMALVRFARGRGGVQMRKAACGLGSMFGRLAQSQDMIGWRRFMEGMISKVAVEIQQAHYNLWRVKKSADRWAQGLSTKLMEATHGQWMYRNVQVHDATQGEERTKRKEELRDAITRQIDLGAEDLEEDDQYLMELVLQMDSLEESSGESQEYWLLAIAAAREACRLRRGGNEDEETSAEDE